MAVLSLFHFELILLAPGAEEQDADAARAVRGLAPGTVVVLQGQEISGSTVLGLLGLTGGGPGCCN